MSFWPATPLVDAGVRLPLPSLFFEKTHKQNPGQSWFHISHTNGGFEFPPFVLPHRSNSSDSEVARFFPAPPWQESHPPVKKIPRLHQSLIAPTPLWYQTPDSPEKNWPPHELPFVLLGYMHEVHVEFCCLTVQAPHPEYPLDFA